MIPPDNEDENNCETPTKSITDMKPFEDHQVGRTVMAKCKQCPCGSHHPHSSES